MVESFGTRDGEMWSCGDELGGLSEKCTYTVFATPRWCGLALPLHRLFK